MPAYLPFQCTVWDEISCEYTELEVVALDDPKEINFTIEADHEGEIGGWDIVASHRIQQNGNRGWFIQLRSDRGHLSLITAITTE